MNKETLTISISIPLEVKNWVDEQCEAWKVSRSNFISSLLWNTMIRCCDEYQEGLDEH